MKKPHSHTLAIRSLAAAGFAALALSACRAFADTETVDGVKWTYTVANGKATVGSGSENGKRAVPISTAGSLSIPATLGGCPVTGVANYAFKECTRLTGVTVPEGVTIIGTDAFEECTKLTGVTLPASVTSIGNGAFGECVRLKGITLPEGLTRIGNDAFESCQKLSCIVIPASVTSIGSDAFEDCRNLKTVVLSKGLKSLGKDAFEECVKLTSLYVAKKCPISDASLRAQGIPASCKIVRFDILAAFDANGGTGSMAAQKMTYGKSAKLSANTFKRSGYVFAGWATSKALAKKGTIAYKNKGTVKNLAARGSAATLYAVWAKKSYKVAFYANGGTGKMAAQKMTYGKSAKLSANKFKHSGYTFSGWAKSKNGKVVYTNKKAVKNLVKNGKTVKLYAVWKKK